MAEDGLIRDITVNNLDVQGSLKLNSNIIEQEQINNVISGMFFASTSENGSGNTGYGYQTPGTTGSGEPSIRSTSIGYQACKTGGTDNTAVGYKALESSSKTGNTAIGFQAGDNITTGNYNVCIGHGVDAPTANSEKTLTIGSNGTNWISGDSTGLVTIPNNLTVTSNLDVVGNTEIDGNFDIATNKFRVTSATGNTSIAGTLDVADNTSISGTLDVVGNTEIDGNFDIATNKFRVTSATGNTSIAGTLDVADNTSISGTLDVADNTSIAGNFDVATNKFSVTAQTGNTSIAGTLDVADNTSISGTLDVADNTSISGTLDVEGDINIQRKIKGDVVIGEDSTDLMVINSKTKFSNVRIDNKLNILNLPTDITDLEYGDVWVDNNILKIYLG